MMLVVIVPFLLGHGIFALVALPILLSGMFGMRFSKTRKEELKNVKEKEKSVSAVAE